MKAPRPLITRENRQNNLDHTLTVESGEVLLTSQLDTENEQDYLLIELQYALVETTNSAKLTSDDDAIIEHSEKNFSVIIEMLSSAIPENEITPQYLVDCITKDPESKFDLMNIQVSQFDGDVRNGVEADRNFLISFDRKNGCFYASDAESHMSVREAYDPKDPETASKLKTGATILKNLFSDVIVTMVEEYGSIEELMKQANETGNKDIVNDALSLMLGNEISEHLTGHPALMYALYFTTKRMPRDIFDNPLAVVDLLEQQH